MTNYDINTIEYLRSKANLTYEQAVDLLDRYNGDVVRILVELERSGALDSENSGTYTSYSSGSYSRESFTQSGSYTQPIDDEPKRGEPGNDLRAKLSVLLKYILVVERNDRLLLRLPAVLLAACALISPHLAILSVLLMLFTGCRVHIECELTRESRSERTVHHPYHSGKKDDDDHFGSYTVG